MWAHLAHVQLPEAQWVLAGDFNNIESTNDKQGGSAKISINNRELEAWNKLLLRLEVRDAYHAGTLQRKNNRTFTWLNFHTDETMIQTRIDMFYTAPQLEQKGLSIHIMPIIPHISDYADCLTYQKPTQAEDKSALLQQRPPPAPEE